MGEEHINKWLASIPIYGQFYLAEKLRKAIVENHRLEVRRLKLAKGTAEIEQQRDSLEQALKRTQPKLDALEQLKIRIEAQKRDIEATKKERGTLQERLREANDIASKNANAVLVANEKKERWKQWAHTLKEVIKDSDAKADDAIHIVMPEIINILGLRVLFFDKDEKISFATPAAAERLRISISDITNKQFTKIFDCPSINWLLTIGPEYPLLVAETGEEVGAAIAEVPYDDSNKYKYAIALREPAAKQGLVRRFVPNRIPAPQNLVFSYRKDIASALAASSAKAKFSSDIYIDLRKTTSIDHKFGEWLASIIKERNQPDNRGTVYLCMPSERVYRQLRSLQIPDKNIKLPRKTGSMRSIKYTQPAAIALVRGT
ncbi:hypothetical protein KY338_01905 [Candidatus Woesearchaeota archaeon]|nr:hypothetical protein [Candidatus Woesearchaeota archaeon]MBW3005969.1 hypothetical protein [Candidatus Woesearchaeota archaeon]